MDVTQWLEFCEKELEPGHNASDAARTERFRNDFFAHVEKFVQIPEAKEKKLFTIDGIPGPRSSHTSNCTILITLCFRLLNVYA